MKFEALNPANQAAEDISRKERCDVYVGKSNAGGIHYIVSKTKVGKVLSHYQNGNLMPSGSEPLKPMFTAPVLPPQQPVKVEEKTEVVEDVKETVEVKETPVKKVKKEKD